jgi:hypothetical protein
LDPELKRALAERVRYYNELGIYDFYRREPPEATSTRCQDAAILENPAIQPEQRDLMTPRSKAAIAVPVEENIFEVANPKPESGVLIRFRR